MATLVRETLLCINRISDLQLNMLLTHTVANFIVSQLMKLWRDGSISGRQRVVSWPPSAYRTWDLAQPPIKWKYMPLHPWEGAETAGA